MYNRSPTDFRVFALQEERLHHDAQHIRCRHPNQSTTAVRRIESIKEWKGIL